MRQVIDPHTVGQLMQLLSIGRQAHETLSAIERAAVSILGIDGGAPESDLVIDAITQGHTVEELLDALAITVEAPPCGS